MAAAQAKYDYVIVGGGSAGCVLAHRLSEDPQVRVLLLEAGGRDVNPLISIPLGVGKLHAWNLHDWGYETEPEAGLNNRRLEAMRGKVMGGSSSINVMAYTRGHPDDFDAWARSGLPAWDYESVLPFFRRSEHWEGGSDRWRGASGPVGTQYARTTDPLFTAWVSAGRQAGFPVTADYNGAQAEGFGRGQYTIRDGRRSSASRAYLRPVRHRGNLVVKPGAHALRVILENRRAVGVDFLRKGQVQRVRAAREVVLSAGTFNSPQLLMLSGIGASADLQALDIRPVLDLPGVGRNLQDHLGVWLTWQRRQPGLFHAQMRADRMAVNMLRAWARGTGPATTVPGGVHAFVKTTAAQPVPDIEFMFHTVPPQTRLWFPGVRAAYQDAYAIRPTLLHPASVGSAQLRSADPLDAVRIAYGFLSDSRDLPRLREGVRLARKVGMQPAMGPFRGPEAGQGAAAHSDAEIDAFIRATALTAHHPSGTCAMGEGVLAVVDARLRVRGIDGLRIADASVMPTPVSAHPNACVLMIAERAAEFITKGDNT